MAMVVVGQQLVVAVVAMGSMVFGVAEPSFVMASVVEDSDFDEG